MGRLIEGLWDCKYCGTTRIRGGIRECPNCGKAIDENTTFYMGTGPKNYVPKAQAAKINRNPDWICDYCNQLNSDNDAVCVSCVAPRTEESLDYFQNKQKQKETPNANSYDATFSTFEDSSTTSSKSTGFLSTFSSLSSFFAETWKPMLIILLIAISIFGIIMLFQPKEYELTVDELSWERRINVERYQTIEESDWYLPSGSRLLHTSQEYSHSEQVLDHYETRTQQVAKQRISGYETYVSGYRDLGNGYFEEITSERPVYETYYETETYQEPVYRSEPVYRTKYYYEIDKWIYERSVVTSGTDNSPYWGNTSLASDERISSQSETYIVKGTDLKTEESISFYLSFEDWSSLNINQTLKVKISFGYGEILE